MKIDIEREKIFMKIFILNKTKNWPNLKDLKMRKYRGSIESKFLLKLSLRNSEFTKESEKLICNQKLTILWQQYKREESIILCNRFLLHHLCFIISNVIRVIHVIRNIIIHVIHVVHVIQNVRCFSSLVHYF